MACFIDSKSLEQKECEKIHNDLTVIVKSDNKKIPPKQLYIYEIDNTDTLRLPFFYGYNNKYNARPERQALKTISVPFEGTLRDEQIEVKSSSLKILSTKGSIILSMYTGFGKTAVSIALACTIKLKTLVIVNKLILMKQWQESILKFCPSAKVQCLTTKTKLSDDTEFIIINAINIVKWPVSFFNSVGLVIVDECHLIMAETLSKSLFNLQPRYLIGLSATPYRMDGLNSLFDIFFGPEKIIKLMNRKHNVIKIISPFRPRIELARNGRLDWTKVIDSQAENVCRNNLIVDIITYFKDRTFLVLVKRIEQGQTLYQKLFERNDSVTTLLGSTQNFDKDARILIGTTSKIGTGFDHHKLDTLILCSDIEAYFLQYLGRVFRTQDNIPLIIDIVDDNNVLKKHYLSREKVYSEIGGIIYPVDTKKNKDVAIIDQIKSLQLGF